MENFLNLVSKHGGNFLRTGAFMVISAITSASLKESTSQSLQEISKDFRKARNNLREKRNIAS